VISNLTVPGDRGTDAVRDLHLEVRSGEIVGIAGVSGNGQRELAEAIAGLRTPTSGSIRLNGVETAGRGPAEIRERGLGYVPEERTRDGMIAGFSVSENLMLVDHRDPRFSRWGFLRPGAIQRHCAELVSAFRVKTPGLSTPGSNLSGGNIQKLVLARELSGSPRVLLVAQPTRGVDVGAAEYIQTRLLEQRGHGTAILIISGDLDEVLALSDRILVMYEGTIIGEVDAQSATREALGLMMAGVRPDAQEEARA
ncbi:MAG TPA: ATP-binding cassette domain-containing protein, partial [Actinomycetota bacterium]|nr:ATP-binding cassette domain-containing protein [Actinomycetota bacterium]